MPDTRENRQALVELGRRPSSIRAGALRPARCPERRSRLSPCLVRGQDARRPAGTGAGADTGKTKGDLPCPKSKKPLTPEMVRDYVNSGGARCPFCGSDDIEAGPLEADADSAWGPVTCTACGREWQDVYLLGAIDLTDKNGQHTTIMPAPEG